MLCHGARIKLHGVDAHPRVHLDHSWLFCRCRSNRFLGKEDRDLRQLYLRHSGLPRRRHFVQSCPVVVVGVSIIVRMMCVYRLLISKLPMAVGGPLWFTRHQ